MIDYVNIELIGYNYRKLLANSLLDFVPTETVNTETGEVEELYYIAKYKGLFIEIEYNAEKEQKYKCSIRGSLHRFWNNGKNNANDFKFKDLVNAIVLLCSAFGFDPNNAKLHGLEFGVNVFTLIMVGEFIKNLVCDGNNEFSIYVDENGKRFGREIIKQRHRLKAYNKGKQAGLKVKDLLRVEVAVKKMQHLKDKNLDINTLADLQDLEKVNSLFPLLLEQWEKLIYWDDKVNRSLLTKKQTIRYERYGNRIVWENYSPNERIRAREQYKKLLEKADKLQTFKKISSLIIDKWHQLGECKKVNNLVESLPVNKPQRSCKNPCCSNSIEHKNKLAKYCSKQCNNKVNGLKRTKQNQQIRIKETDILNKVIKQMPKGNLWLSVSYSENIKDSVFTDYLHQSEICPDKDFIKQVRTIDIDPIRKNGKRLIITSTRARKLIRLLTKHNTKNGKF